MGNDNFKTTDGFHDLSPQNECSDGMLKILDGVSRLSDLSFMAVTFPERKLIYKSRNLLFVNKATRKDMQRESYNPYWALMDQEDYDLMLDIEKAYQELVIGFKDEEKRQHTFIMNFSISFGNKKHIVTQKFTPLKLRDDGSLSLGLFMTTIAPNNSCKKNVVLGVDFKYTYDLNKRKFLPLEDYAGLTLMERGILLRSAEGLTTKQIATDLCKSVNTIKTHRQRIFAKLGVKSTNEALAFISGYNLFFDE